MDLDFYKRLVNYEKDHWWFKGRRTITKSIIKQFHIENNTILRVLEIGCGTGANIEALKALDDNVEVNLIEPEEYAREYIQTNYGLNVHNVLLPNQELPFEKNYFDVIIMLDVLEHIDDDIKTLEVLHEYLKDDGHLIIAVPSYTFLWSNNDVVAHHKRRYTKTSLKKVVKDEQFEILKASYFNLFFFPLAVMVILYSKWFNKEVDNFSLSYGKKGESLLLLNHFTITQNKSCKQYRNSL